MTSRLRVLAFRARASNLHARLTRGSLAQAAACGLQDSAPRSAVLSLHARVEGVSADDWAAPTLAQIWGPRGALYVVPANEVSVFTTGRLPRGRARLEEVESATKNALKVRASKEDVQYPSYLPREHLRSLRVASMTGRLRVRWDGSRISWWEVDPPPSDSEEARLELARRFLAAYAPATAVGFSWWAGVDPVDARETFLGLKEELAEVRSSGTRAWVLESDRAKLSQSSPPDTVRMLPQGDPYLGMPDREFVAPDAADRASLWPRSVWPGALFVRGELLGTWRRQQGKVQVRLWRRVDREVQESISSEVQSMPLMGEKTVAYVENLP